MMQRRAESGAKVLSAWMHDPRFQRAWKPEFELFVSAEQRAAAQVMATLEPPVDVDRLTLALHRHGALKYFAAGADDVLALTMAPAVVDPWKELQVLRELKALAVLREGLRKSLIAIENEGCSLDDARTRVSDALLDASSSLRAEAMTVKGLLFDALSGALQPLAGGIMTTGFSAIDEVTGGIRAGDTFVFGAETNFGKTAMAVLLWHLALLREGIRPCVVSFEDAPNLYARRLLAMRAKISALRLRDHKLRRYEIDAANDVVAKAEDHPSFIDARGRTVESVAADMRSLAASDGINFWLVDYLQAIDTVKDFGKERRLHLNHCVRQLINVFQQTGGAGYIFSQITKDPNKKHPDKESLRDTKDLAIMVTCVMLGLLETVQKDVGGQPTNFQQRSIFVDKVKDGPSKFTLDVEWNSLFAGFVPDLTTNHQQEPLSYEQQEE